MTRKLSATLAIVVSTLATATAPAPAQTVGNGPYYATPSWDQTLPAATRFIVLSNMGSAAVLDRETGLVWERSPSPQVESRTGGMSNCAARVVGNRLGWRLPTIQELTSLIDRSVAAPGLKLPVGHPFTGNAFDADAFWAATGALGRPETVGYVVGFVSGLTALANETSFLFPIWCVRGGSGPDLQ